MAHTNILGISAFYHDSAACLVSDGKIISAAQEERFTRKKHDQSFPVNAVNYCLTNSGLAAKNLDYVAFYEKPFLKFERLLETYLAYTPAGINSFLKAMPLWLKQKLWIKDLIAGELDYKREIIFPEHHLSHASSAFFPSPFQEAAFLTLDGVGEWTTTSYGVGEDNNIRILSDIKFPHSVGLLYSAFTYYLGFRVNSGEYKVMGLAPYGEPKYKDLILSELIDVKDDGSFRLNMKYFDYCAGLSMTNSKFHKLFGGPPRRPETELTQRHMDIAHSIQEATEEIMLKMAKYVHRQTGKKNLCLAGGVALNCVGNGRILKETPFENIWIQPAAGDAGGAVGAALFVWYQYLGNKRIADGKNDFMQGSCLGPSFGRAEISNFLKENNIGCAELTREEILKRAADLIAEGKVIGWFQGRMEFGPRALGNRSILGDARSTETQKKMNLKIKFRESFRPFAPAVILEKMPKYFELEKESPYMLLTAPVSGEVRAFAAEDVNVVGLDKLNVRRSEIPAVTHVDYSARVQSVNKLSSPLFHDLIARFGEKYKHPVVVNTSFNVRGEPMVCSPEDAYNCFMRTQMDYLIMENFLIDKKAQKGSVDFHRESRRRTPQEKSYSKKESRNFFLTAGCVFLILGVLLVLFKKINFPWISFAGLFFIMAAAAAPVALKPLYKVWLLIGMAVNWAVTRAFLGVSFYLIFFPIGLILRLFGKKFLDLSIAAETESYWHSRKQENFERSIYEKQF